MGNEIVNTIKTDVQNNVNGKQQVSKKNKSELDKDAFLNLLVTQLKYQDPLNPTQDKEFLAQMAQFSSLEQMQNLNKSFQRNYGLSLVGRDVQAVQLNEDTNETEVIDGIIENVRMENDKCLVTINDKDIDISNVKKIFDNSAIQSPLAFSMIGKYIEGVSYNKETESFEGTKGIVESVRKHMGKYFLKVDGKEVVLDHVIKVGGSQQTEPTEPEPEIEPEEN